MNNKKGDIVLSVVSTPLYGNYCGYNMLCAGNLLQLRNRRILNDAY